MKILEFYSHQNIPISFPLKIDEITFINTIKNIYTMFKLIKEQYLVGLAVPQIDWNKKLIMYVVDPSTNIRKNLSHIPDIVMINSIIENVHHSITSEYEGNLIIDNIIKLVDKPAVIQITCLTVNKHSGRNQTSFCFRITYYSA